MNNTICGEALIDETPLTVKTLTANIVASSQQVSNILDLP